MRISHQLTIRRDPEAVFAWIEDPELASRWQPDVVDYEITGVSPGIVGTEFREHLRGAHGSVEMRGRVTAYERNALMEFDLTGGGAWVRARYALTPVASGTALRVDTEIRLGRWFSRLLEPLVRSKILKQVRSELELLRNLCEAGAERQPPLAAPQRVPLRRARWGLARRSGFGRCVPANRSMAHIVGA